MDGMQKILFEKNDTGIEMSFILYIPSNISNDSSLILNGITPGVGTPETYDEDEKFNTNKFGTYSDSYKEALNVASKGYFSRIYKKIAINYNNPMLIPLIPRCDGLYTGFLGYDVYHENYSNAVKLYEQGISNFSSEDLEKFRSLDVQIAQMIYYSINFINKKYDLNLDYKVIATGYSASSKMVNYFTALHPDLVKMVIGGGTGGLTIIPTKDFDYPLGFKDLNDENLLLYKKIPQFYYIGKDDQNDPSRPKIDEDGEYILRNGGFYSLEQVKIIHPKYSDVQKRFDRVKEIYEEQGLDNIVFKKYNGDHEINDDTLENDIFNFYESNLYNKNSIKK